MSAIAGLFWRDGQPIDSSVVHEMIQVLRSRCPDGQGVWSEGSVGFAQGLLRTTPESEHEARPLEQSGLVLTGDVRIDNRQELLAALSAHERARAGLSDEGLVLAAYRRWGRACGDHLLGDFALAVWDRARRSLLLMRDHFGVKPLYYVQTDRFVAFASEIKALLALPFVPRRLNEERIGDYLLAVLEDTESTFYRDIRRLPPGHSLTVTNDRSELCRYWQLEIPEELRLGSEGEYVEAFTEVFGEAVRSRLRSAGRVSAALSGGLDSSAIVAVARDDLARRGDRLVTLSATCEDVPQSDERSFIDAVVTQGQVEPHRFRADLISPLGLVETMTARNDEPVFAPNNFIHWELYRTAAAAGAQIFLDGIDGDSTLSHGFGHLVWLARTGHWLQLRRELIGVSEHYYGDLSPRGVLRRRVIGPLAPARLKALRRRFRRNPPSPYDPTLNSHFVERIGLLERQAELSRDTSSPVKNEREEHWRLLAGGWASFVLEIGDRGAASFAVEPRYPFFDRRLVDFCLSLPAEQKIKDGWTRLIARRAMTGMLPARVAWRSGKSDLSFNFDHTLRLDRHLLERVIAQPPPQLADYVDLSALRTAFQDFQVTGRAGVRLWRPVTLALWLEQTETPAP